MYLVLFISAFLELADGCIDVHFLSILESYDKRILKFIGNAALITQYLIIVGRCSIGIFIDSAFAVRLHTFQPLESFVVSCQRS